MVSGIPTASGYEERIRFSELEVVDAGAIDHGVLSTLPEGHYMNGWDVNVAGVRTTSVKRNIRYHKHAVSLLETPLEHLLILFRNLYLELKGRTSWSSLLEDGMEISRGFTTSYGRNCQGRSSHLCQGRTSKARRHQIY